MEESLQRSNVIIPICSASFVRKANDRTVGTGAGLEAILISRLFHAERDTRRFLPVLRDSDKTAPPHERVPRFLGTLLYIDMDTDDWRGEPFQRLLDALRQRRAR
jgi:TIR domain